jgi:ribosome-associated toxin RatA of RatAB toxin-antitoxin module
MKLIKGPFKEFTAKWGFKSLNESKTSLTFTMEYNISNPLVNLAFTKNLNLVSEKIIKAFKKELTEKVY